MNAGRFPVALNRMVGKFFSMARNPGISKMFRWADLCENEGFGMDELLSLQKITNSKVEIESEREFSRVIFPDRFRSIDFALNDNDCYNLMFTKKYWCPKKYLKKL